MTTAFDIFRATVTRVKPRAAVVLGSGLGAAVGEFAPAAEVCYADVPGMVRPTVHGHRGRMAVGTWAGVPAVVCFGRVHFYEGHPWDRVTVLVRLLADFGVRALVLTNAAGGLHPKLVPGQLMAIGGHLKLVSADGWKTYIDAPAGNGTGVYSPRLVDLFRQLENEAGRDLLVGTYATMTGPCYETPAEIRALRQMGADAVGMSTAVEAEVAAGLGLDVAGLSCITNQAAGISDGPLSHAEVEETARDTVGRVGQLLGGLMKAL